MKNLFFTIMLTVCVLGCVKVHFYEYKNKTLSKGKHGFSVISDFEGATIFLKCGFYSNLVGDKEKKLILVAYLRDSIQINEIDIKATSKKIGFLSNSPKNNAFLKKIPKHNSFGRLLAVKHFNFSTKKERKILKAIEQDTLEISFMQGATLKKYYFFRN